MKTVKKKTSELEVRVILSVAPNEGEFPRDPSADLMGDIMAFPGVYGGRSRRTPIKKWKKKKKVILGDLYFWMYKNMTLDCYNTIWYY